MFLGLLDGVQVLNFVVPGMYFKYEDTPTSRGVLVHIRKTGSSLLKRSIHAYALHRLIKNLREACM
jgi:hypothetical protein